MRSKKPMSTSDYVKKHNLSVSDKFNHASFVNDLKKDFNKLITQDIQIAGKLTEDRFKQKVTEIKCKFDAIGNKTSGQIPEKLFNYFFATVVVPKRNSFFGKVEVE